MPNVLVVDDAAVDRCLVEGLLKKDPNYNVEAAHNGAEALERLGNVDQRVDVVVTDLCMPEMDGLELVTSVQLQHPQIPVILITANGSEELAMAALDQGAASYVPKKYLADKLKETVDQVFALSKAERSYEQLSQNMDFAEMHFTLQQDKKVFERLIELVQQMMSSMGIVPSADELRMVMAIEEAFKMLVHLGNLELSMDEFLAVELHDEEVLGLVAQRATETPFCDRKISVRMRLGADESRFVFTHDGPGIDIDSIPAWNDPSALDQPSCRGLVLVHSFMDEVQFDSDGKSLTLAKSHK